MKTIKLADAKNGDVVIDMDGKRILIIDNIYDSQETCVRITGSSIIMQNKQAIYDDTFIITAPKIVKVEPNDDFIKSTIRYIFERVNEY